MGFRIPNQDAEAIARGNAFVATADNPSAIYYNPAGITQLKGQHFQMGAHVISVNSHYRGPGGVTADTDYKIQAVPQFYYTVACATLPISFGLGVFAPYGLGLEWPDNTPFRTLAVEGRLQYVTVAPVVAWQVLPNLSIGAGPTLNHSTAMLRRAIGIVPGDEFRFRGNDLDFGAKAGVLWQPHPKWSLGVSYHSPTTLHYRGTSTAKPIVSAKYGTSAELEFPQFVMAGVSFRPTPKWNLEAAVDWTDWDVLNTAVFKGTAFGDVPFAFNWKSSLLYHLGVERYFPNGYWVGAGYFYSENSTTDPDFNPIVPDTNLHVGSLGFGRKGKRWSWALSGQVITGPPRAISNGNAADGSYQFFNQAVNFSVGLGF